MKSTSVTDRMNYVSGICISAVAFLRQVTVSSRGSYVIPDFLGRVKLSKVVYF